MSSLRARQLLIKAAEIANRQKEAFSKPEIVEKINEIKYLSSQKKVPRLTLRKEIIHLENKLKNVLEFEKEYKRHKHRESTKVTALKNEIKSLKKKISLTEDKDFTRKVDKISHILGDQLARKGTEEEVELCQKILKEAKKKKGKPLDPKMVERINALQRRLTALRHEIKIHTELESKDPKELKEIQTKVDYIQEKLMLIYEKHPELMEDEMSKIEVKHHMKMNIPKQGELIPVISLDQSLPLPPPPRISE